MFHCGMLSHPGRIIHVACGTSEAPPPARRRIRRGLRGEGAARSGTGEGRDGREGGGGGCRGEGGLDGHD